MAADTQFSTLAGHKVPKDARAVVHDAKTKSLNLTTLIVPCPEQSDQHLIRVRAVALTNGELSWPEPAEVETPIPGYDMSGTVITSPVGSPFPPGTNVFARTAFARAGSARQYSIATTDELAQMPKNISFEEAATVPISALTAWQALCVHGTLAAPCKPTRTAQPVKHKSPRVLITAASGGVGLWAVQLASIAGAYVVGTCSSKNVDYVKDLGADEVLDYAMIDISQWTLEDPASRQFDLVLDCVGGETLKKAWSCVRQSGLLISIADDPKKHLPNKESGTGISSAFFIVEADHNQLSNIAKLIELGKCTGIVNSVFNLEDYELAFKKAYEARGIGKVVIKIE